MIFQGWLFYALVHDTMDGQEVKTVADCAVAVGAGIAAGAIGKAFKNPIGSLKGAFGW